MERREGQEGRAFDKGGAACGQAPRTGRGGRGGREGVWARGHTHFAKRNLGQNAICGAFLGMIGQNHSNQPARVLPYLSQVWDKADRAKTTRTYLGQTNSKGQPPPKWVRQDHEATRGTNGGSPIPVGGDGVLNCHDGRKILVPNRHQFRRLVCDRSAFRQDSANHLPHAVHLRERTATHNICTCALPSRKSLRFEIDSGVRSVEGKNEEGNKSPNDNYRLIFIVS